jgi:hypothetical protein
LVEGALRSALAPEQNATPSTPNAPALFDQLGLMAEKPVKVVLDTKPGQDIP